MTDRWIVALAGCAIVGALRPTTMPLWVGVSIASSAFVRRRPALVLRRPEVLGQGVLCVGVLVLTSALAERALAGLDDVVAEPVSGEITLLSDPTPVPGGVRADVRFGSRRLELRAEGPSAVALADRLAGERVVVRGEVQRRPPDVPWLTARHIAGRLRVYAVEAWHPGGTLARIANGLRRTLHAGAVPLDPVQRSLYMGLVIGDDRAQSAEMADAFQGAGLTHLLAVSGENVDLG